MPARPPLRTTRPATFRSRAEPPEPDGALSPDAAQPHSGPQPASASAATVRSGAEPRASSAPLEFDRLYVEHFHHVSRWVRALGGRPADLDDLTQDVFVVVRRKLATFAGPSLPAWLYGITRKVVSDYRRRAWIRRLLSGAQRSLDVLPMGAQLSGVEAVERREARRILQRVLDQMSTVRRSAFVLFEIEGYSGDEIAELEQVPLATVYTRLHHARKDFLRLTAALTGEQAEEPPS